MCGTPTPHATVQAATASLFSGRCCRCNCHPQACIAPVSTPVLTQHGRGNGRCRGRGSGSCSSGSS
eukprot:1355399-Alexandrium_andersonii.AAC.1